MPLDEDFLKEVRPLYSPVMGTENMAPLLYSLIRFERPRSLLEIGAGYTTPFIAQALCDNVGDWEEEKKRLGAQNSIFSGDYYAKEYSPGMLCIDNNTHPQSTASKVQSVISSIGLDNFVSIVGANFQEYAERIDESRLPFDFVWFDCGGLKEYFIFYHEYWKFVDPNGGLLLMHSTLTNLEIINFVKTIKLSQATTDFHNMELLSLLEPHKIAQNSVTLIRKISNYHEHIYSMSP